MENLRQKCIWLSDKAIWWNYISNAHTECYTDFSEDCSKNVHEELGLSWSKTTDCVDASFNEAENDNELLKEDAVEWVLRGPHFIPAVVINKISYRGTLDPENVFNAICEGFKDPQPECYGLGPTGINKPVNLIWFGIAIIAIILLNLVVLCLCRRCSTKDMKLNVNSAIQEYMSLRKNADPENLPEDSAK